MDKFNCRSPIPNSINIFSVIFGLDEATLSLCFHFMQFKEISHNTVIYFSLLIIESGNSPTVSLQKAGESVQENTGNGAEVQLK
jgi:hypothetical protein